MNFENIQIRETKDTDFNDIMEVEKQAFVEDSEAELTAQLLNDKSAKPRISLIAFDGNKAVGHILFTKTTIERNDICPLMHILAPLAVIPEYQKQGIGGKLVREGLKRIKEIGSEIVFVLGHTEYYPKYGFIPNAERLGYSAPNPIPTEVADAWMVQPLTSKVLSNFGKVICADMLNKPEYWQE
ncbi:MAG: GNAT family N-acetyltransferase [Planctomycetia bacterium]|nr:GNAT family N-acetyltransferase [Planctomycetia bacterium]